jgi:hypothetical protein
LLLVVLARYEFSAVRTKKKSRTNKGRQFIILGGLEAAYEGAFVVNPLQVRGDSTRSIFSYLLLLGRRRLHGAIARHGAEGTSAKE